MGGSHSLLNFTKMPLETQFSIIKNTNLLFPVSITLTQNFWVLSDGNTMWKSNQTKKFVWVPYFLRTQLWVLSDITQNCSKPSRPLFVQIRFSLQSALSPTCGRLHFKLYSKAKLYSPHLHFNLDYSLLQVLHMGPQVWFFLLYS